MKPLIENKKVKMRALREQAAWDDGSVWKHNREQLKRFWHVFECPNKLKASAKFSSRVENAMQGADILEIGCFEGACAVKLFSKRAFKSYIGIDISPVAIATAQEKLTEGRFKVMNGEELAFPDQSFDIVFGHAVLHHLEWEKTIKGIARVLKPGGRAFFTEPLGDNPAAKLWRKMTPNARTPDETPVTRKQIELANKMFGHSDHIYTSLFSTIMAVGTSLFLSRPDNIFLRACDHIDVIVARTPARYWMRQVMLDWTR